MNLGEMIAELRKDKGALQRDLAELLGVSVGTISNYETGTHEPDLKSLVMLADYFNVTTDYLLGRTKFQVDFNAITDTFAEYEGKTIANGDLIALSAKLSAKSKALLVDYIEMLRLREDCK